MKTVVAAFVGYAPNFELPWAVGTDHGKASFTLDSDQERCEWKCNNQPTWYGFVVKDDDGSYAYADRKEAYTVAKQADQLNGKKGLPDRLDSFQVSSYDSNELLHLSNMSWDTNEAFKHKVFECDTDKRLTADNI